VAERAAGVGLMKTQLVRYDAMCSAIATAHRVDEVKNIRDKTLAIAAYAKQAKNRDAERMAQEIRVRAERKTGQLLSETPKAKGGNPNLNRSKPATGLTPATLAKLGISKDQSADWQKLAKVPDEKFEAALTDKDTLPSGRSIVAAGLHNLKVRQDEKLRERGELVPVSAYDLRKLARGLEDEHKWTITEACSFAFQRSEAGKKLISRIAEVMPAGFKMLPCEKTNSMVAALTQWIETHWMELPIPPADELGKLFAIEAERRRR
jgi:hypothetical protein